MDLVDIDKVLDDFELNEDNKDNVKLPIVNNLKNNVVVVSDEVQSFTHKNVVPGTSNAENHQEQTNNIEILNKEQPPSSSYINEEYNRSSHVISETVGRTQQPSLINTTVAPKVNVSNVFTSLNEYVNAGLDTKLQNLSVYDEPPSTIAPRPPLQTIKNTPGEGVQQTPGVESSQSSDSLKVLPSQSHSHHKKHENRSKQPKSQTNPYFYSNSSSVDSLDSSTTSSGSGHTTPSTNTSSDEEDGGNNVTQPNDEPIETKQLIPSHVIHKPIDHNNYSPITSEDKSENIDEDESMNQVSEIRTCSNQINNKTTTIFSSSSSYCYNENNSTDVTFSNDIVSLNETSSLSSLVNISNNVEGKSGEVVVGVDDNEPHTIEEDVDSYSDLKTTKNDDDDIESIDRTTPGLNDKDDDKNDVQISEDLKFDDFETKVIEKVVATQPQHTKNVATKPIGFESTMDDVSDTELESYLQELEFETTTNSGSNSVQPQPAQPQPSQPTQSIPPPSETVSVESVECSVVVSDKDEQIEVREVDKSLNETPFVEIVEKNDAGSSRNESVEPTPPPTSVTKEEKNVDNISQASTVECNEIVLSHTDIDDKIIISSDESPMIEESVTTDHHEVVEDVSGVERPIEAGTRALNAEDEATTTTTSSQAKRPNSLNFPTAPPPEDEVASAGQTPPPPPHNELTDSHLSSSSSDEITGMHSSTIPPINRGALEIHHEHTPLSGTPSRQHLGKIQPYWVPDADAINCMLCDMKFTLMKRRHHCRACGKVLCSSCCSMKAKIEFLGGQEARVCQQCDLILNHMDRFEDDSQPGASSNVGPGGSGVRSPNPNNPMEYCSRLPPHQQASNPSGAPISVMVPVGVLKREGAPKSARKEKNVIFSDGIRPGNDLTELDNWDVKSSGSSNYGRKSGSKRVQTPPGESSNKVFRNNVKLPKVDETNNSYIPKEENGLPPIYVAASKTDYKFVDVSNDAQLVTRLHSEELKFAIQRNFFVYVKILKLSCCINRTVINFTTQGLRYVGQDEIIILLQLDDSNLIPKDIFLHLNEIYQNADKGQTITELGCSIPHPPNFLGSKEHGGFLYIRQTFQCLQGVNLPEAPYLIGILIHRWEVPWAKIFPLRLMLRLGALYRYYPSPHISERGRDSVYAEIAQTVINFLADFRTYSYTISTIRGMTIHMEDREICITIPRNRYDQVVKAIADSSDHILALGGVFSKKAGGHLVCIQNTESGCSEMYQYSTQAINIDGQPRKVTGTSFFILNGALKTTSGLSGKCTVVEDGLMVQILPQTMTAVREALKNIKDYKVVCGPVDATPEQSEIVSIVWGDNDLEFNIGVISPIDSKAMDGVPSIRVHKGLEFSNVNHIFRWTEVFILKSDEDSPHGRDQVDISKISEKIARSTATAIVPFLDLLSASGLTKLGLRVTLDPESVCYEAGSQQNKLPPLYMKALDNELIPTLHRHASNLQTDTPIILELIFNILDK